MTEPGPAASSPPGGADAADRLDPARLDELWDFGDPAASADRFRAELGRLPAGGLAQAELQTQLARATGLLGDQAEALALLDIAAGAHPDSALLDCRVQLERGRIDLSAGRAESSVPHFSAALAAARAAGDDFLAVDALHMLALADTTRELDWTRQGLKITATATDPRVRRWAGSLRNNLGWTLHGQGDFAGALHQFEAAQEAYSADGTPEQVRVAHWAVARALRSLGRYGEAMTIQRRLLGTGTTDGFVHEELAELLLAQGDPAAAAPHFAQAAELLGADPWFAQHEADRLARLRELSG